MLLHNLNHVYDPLTPKIRGRQTPVPCSCTQSTLYNSNFLGYMGPSDATIPTTAPLAIDLCHYCGYLILPQVSLPLK